MDELSTLVNAPAEGGPDVWRRWKPGRIAITIDAEGRWFYKGDPISRPSMLSYFARRLFCEGGKYYLASDWQKLEIAVEDVPFIAVTAEWREDGFLWLQTSLGDWFCVDGAGAWQLRNWKGCDVPYARFCEGLWVRLARSVYYELVSLAHPVNDGEQSSLGLVSGGYYLSLGYLAEPHD